MCRQHAETISTLPNSIFKFTVFKKLQRFYIISIILSFTNLVIKTGTIATENKTKKIFFFYYYNIQKFLITKTIFAIVVSSMYVSFVFYYKFICKTLSTILVMYWYICKYILLFHSMIWNWGQERTNRYWDNDVKLN